MRVTALGSTGLILLVSIASSLPASTGSSVHESPQEDDPAAALVQALSDATEPSARRAQVLELSSLAPASASPEFRGLLGEAIVHADLRRDFPTLFARLQGVHEAAADHAGFLAAIERFRTALAPLSPVERVYLDYRESRAYLSSGEADRSLAGYRAVVGQIDDWREPSGYAEAHGRFVRALATEELVLALLEQGMVDAARRLESAERDGLPGLLRAEIALESGRYETVLERVDELVADGVPLGNNGRLLRGCALARLDRGAEAIEDLEHVLADEASTPILRSTAALALADFYLRSARYDDARGALRRLDDGPPLPALARARRDGLLARWGLLSSAPKAERAAALEALRASYAGWVAAWQSAPLLPAGAHFLRPARRAALIADVMEAELGSDGGPGTALHQLIEAESCGTLARRLGLSASSVDALIRHFESTGGGLLAFVPAPDVTHVFAVDASGVMHGRALTPDALEERCEEFLNWLRADRSATGADFDPAPGAVELTGLVLPKAIQDRLRTWPRVRVAGFQDVLPVPPTLLRLEGQSWLGTEAEIAEWPSMVVGLALERQPWDRSASAVAILDPLVPGRGDLARLPFESARLDELRAAAPGRVAIFEGERAVAARMAAAPAGILYVHSHGESSPRLDRPGVLLLAGPSSPVDAAAIEELFGGQPAPLDVILAACDAGRTRLRFGEDGADHLGSAFLVAGARSCVLPLRKAFHEPSKAFALVYVARLLAGDSPGAAARAARSTMIKQGWDPRDAANLRLIGAACSREIREDSK